VLRHMIEEPEWWGVALVRQEPGDGAGKILWVATLLAMLARRVFRTFGIGTDDLDEVASPIQRLAVDLNDNHPPGTA
jgi:acetyl-CoA acetyltransferase